MFLLAYLNQNCYVKRYNAKKYYLPKGIVKSYNGEKFYDQPIDSDVKRHKETKILTAKQSKDYTKWCLLNYDLIKNH